MRRALEIAGTTILWVFLVLILGGGAALFALAEGLWIVAVIMALMVVGILVATFLMHDDPFRL